MNLFNPSDVQAVADVVRLGYDSGIVLDMYAQVEEEFQKLVSSIPFDAEVVRILVHQIHNEDLINRALYDEEFLKEMVKANTAVVAFHKKFEGVLWRLMYCVNNYKTAGRATILNNLGKAAVLLKVETPMVF